MIGWRIICGSVLSLFFVAEISVADAVDVAAQMVDADPAYSYIEGMNGPIIGDNQHLTGQSAFDCSGLTWYAFGSVGIELALQAESQSEMDEGTLIESPSIADLQRGDLLFFETDDDQPGEVTHVGLYEGNGKMLNAVSEIYDLKRSDLTTSSYWMPRLLKARRLPSYSGTASSTFRIGDKVEAVSDDVEVWQLRQNIILTTDQTARKEGDKGTIVFGPVARHLPGTPPYWWWVVDFDSGVDGWVIEEDLRHTEVNALELHPMRDIWTTSVYSYDVENHFSGCGGGRDDDALRVGGWGDYYYSLLLFDVYGAPGPVSSAKLRLYNTIDAATNTALTVPMNLDRVTSDWDWTENSLGICTLDNERLWWVDRPTYVHYASSLPAPSQPGYWETDVTDLVNGWINGTYANHGLQLRPTETCCNNFNGFASSEHPETRWRPTLILEWAASD